jgi:hypothetical protein
LGAQKRNKTSETSFSLKSKTFGRIYENMIQFSKFAPKVNMAPIVQKGGEES